MIKICLTCAKGFEGRNTSKFCSRSCSGKGPRKYKDIQCRGCGIIFTPISNRHWTCEKCSESKSLQTRVYRYGESGVVIKEILNERNGLCILCDREAKCIDHDHKTLKARGALCHGCNKALSYIEREGWLEAALEYLKRGALESPKTD